MKKTEKVQLHLAIQLLKTAKDEELKGKMGSLTIDFIWPITCVSPDFFVPLRLADGRFFIFEFTYKDTKKYAHLQLYLVN